ncbi:MAG: M56 family metallopeptidase, partial [Lachnospiraceae bacterium]|nr:M56 family metallopeptidase [Lachnospiraceae bacterium]
MIGAVIIARFLLKKSPRWISCLLWGLVAIRLVCPFLPESSLSLLPSAKVFPDNIAVVSDPQIKSGIRIIDNAVNPAVEDSISPNAGDSVNPMQVVVYAGSTIWVIGTAVMLLYALLSYIMLKRRVRASVAVKGNVKICDEVKSPFILGIVRPVIYVPSGMTGGTFDMVTAHENAHLKRHDHWWKPLGFVLLAAHWFNPLCWMAYILLCRDIEAACDEKVIRDKDKEYVAAYSQALLDCSVQRRTIAACPLAFGEAGVKERIKGVLNYKKPAFWVVILSAIVCVALAGCFMTNPKSSIAIENTPDMEEHDQIGEISIGQASAVKKQEMELMEAIRTDYPGIADVSVHLEDQNGRIEYANVYILCDEMIGSDQQNEIRSFVRDHIGIEQIALVFSDKNGNSVSFPYKTASSDPGEEEINNSGVAPANPIGLSMSVENIFDKGCTIVFEQSGGHVTGGLLTGAPFEIQKMNRDGEWVNDIRTIVDWKDIAYAIKRNDVTELEADWQYIHEPLESGYYRIKKEVMDFRKGADYDTYELYAEFVVGSSEHSYGEVTHIYNIDDAESVESGEEVTES